MKTIQLLGSCVGILLAASRFAFAQSPATPPATLAPALPPAPTVPTAPPDPSAPATPSDYVPKPMEYNSAPLIRVDILMVSLAEEKALPLVPLLRDPAQVQAAQTRLLEMIGRKEAVLEGWPEITTHSGLRAVAESITEQRYPIEYEEPTAVATTKGPLKEDLSEAQKALIYLRSAGLVVPTTFETRNVGPTLEAEAVISPDGTSVGIQLAPQLVRFELMRPFDAGVTEKGTKVTVEQPIFSTAKVSTFLALRDGERRLIYFGKNGETRNRVDLFIVGVKIFPAPSGK